MFFSSANVAAEGEGVLVRRVGAVAVVGLVDDMGLLWVNCFTEVRFVSVCMLMREDDGYKNSWGSVDYAVSTVVKKMVDIRIVGAAVENPDVKG
jgi:hypothetical protein